MNTELLTPAVAAPLNLTVDVVEFRSSAAGAQLEEESASIDTCYCCCCSCCGVELQDEAAA